MKAIVAFALVAIMVATPFATAQAHAQQPATKADNELILRVAMQDDIKTLNMLTAGDVWTWNVIGWVFDGLTWQNASNNDHVEPWAAEWFHHGPEDTWDTTVPYPDNDNNDDYQNWTVKLRDGIKWHDWESQTGDNQYVRAHDVIFSLRLAADVSRYAGSIDCVVARDADGNMIYGRDISDKIPDGIYKGPNGDWADGVDVSDQVNYPDLPVVLVTADDDGLTLHYRLMKTYADFPIDTLNALIVPERIWSSHIADKLTWSDPQGLISFGQYKFNFWDEKAQISRIDTFRDYFRPEYDPITGEQKPYIDGILFKVYGTTDAAVMALTSDEVDYIAWAIDPGFIDTINADPHLTLVRNSDLGFFYVAFNMRKPEFGYVGYDPADIPSGGIPTYDHGNYTDVGKPFRVAFAHIINKQYIVSKFLQGFGSVGTSVVSPVNSFWYNPNIKIYNYDPEEAQRILDEQGWTDKDGDGWREFPNRGDEEITMMAPPADYDPTCTHPRNLIQYDAQAIGINLKAIPTNSGTIVQQIVNHEFDIYVLGWSIGDPTASATAPCDFFSSMNDGDGNNYPGYHNESFDRLCSDFMSERDIEKRREIGYRLQETIAEDVPYSVLYYRDVLEAYNNRFSGWIPRFGTIFNRYSLESLYPGGHEFELSVSLPKNVRSGGTVKMSAYVTFKDSGVPVRGAEVSFEADAGQFSPTEGTTDENGMVQVEYTAPETDFSLPVHITVSAKLATGGASSTLYLITVLPKMDLTMYMEVSPRETIQAMDGIPADMEIRVYSGNGTPLSEGNVTIDFSVAPYGASVTFVDFENDTWHYRIEGKARNNTTTQYSLTVSATLYDDGVEMAAASQHLTLIVLGTQDSHTSPPDSDEEANASTYLMPLVGGALLLAAAVSVVIIRRKHGYVK